MKVFKEISITEFRAWGGAKDTQDKIINANMGEDFDYWIEELFPDGIGEMELNDILWVEDDLICETLGIEKEAE
jgi:ABC-type cobalt transport system substrate-binding protein